MLNGCSTSGGAASGPPSTGSDQLDHMSMRPVLLRLNERRRDTTAKVSPSERAAVNWLGNSGVANGWRTAWNRRSGRNGSNIQ